MDRHQLIFFEEARDLLAELEEATLALEQQPSDQELVGRIFRAIHTLKGSSAMFGCEEISHFAHDVETAFDAVREGTMAVSPELITLALQSRDHIALLFQSLVNGQKPDAALVGEGEEILGQIRALMGNVLAEASSALPQAAPATEAMCESELPAVLYRIRFRPPLTIFLSGSNPLFLLDELKEMGESDIVCHSEGRPGPDEINPDHCYDYWDVLLSTSREEQALRDVFIFVEDESEIRIEALGDADAIDDETRRSLVRALESARDCSLATLRAVIDEAARAHRPAEETPCVRPDAGHKASASAPVIAAQDHKTIQSIKVPAEKLDKLVDLVGELVIVQARLSQAALSSSDPQFRSISEEVETLVWELRDNAMSIRMLPIGTTFAKFNRLVRDLSAELGKEIHLTTEGEETELDKTVIERLGDPLVHMIRNCIDHGIESPDARMESGKPRAGTIRLSASHAGAYVHITISDDGRGLDAGAIKAKAVAQGLMDEHGEYSEQEIFAMIFKPGFSTAREVTSVSGRGVGMDVVRRSIEDLSGQIDIQSVQGRGTTITLKIPLTLAIVEGLLVRSGSEYYILPLSIVKECVELPSIEERKGNGGDLINVRGQIVPYVRLRDYYGISDEAPEFEYVVIVEAESMMLGVTVDEVCGQHQTVIKNLGALYRDVRGVSGATILGDGTVALIIDVPSIVAELQHGKKQSA